jgi:hypothetical protein
MTMLLEGVLLKLSEVSFLVSQDLLLHLLSHFGRVLVDSRGLLIVAFVFIVPFHGVIITIVAQII